jgi:hypothetical protein
MFAINIAILLILLFPSLLSEGKGKLAYSIGLLSLILASVVHILLMFAVAILLAFIFYYPTLLKSRRGCITIVAFGVAAFLSFNLLSSNFSTLTNFIQYTLDGKTPRAQIIVRSFTEIPAEYPLMPLIGFGPGQFSSRAALITTGMYFGTPATPTPVPIIPEGMSKPFEKHLLDLWLSLFFDSTGNYVHYMNNTSSTYKPYFSWLSVYTELGLLGSGVVLLLLIILLFKIKKSIRTSSQRLLGTSIASAILLLFLLGIQENYWEVPQAIFVGLLLVKLQYANLIYGQTRFYRQ